MYAWYPREYELKYHLSKSESMIIGRFSLLMFLSIKKESFTPPRITMEILHYFAWYWVLLRFQQAFGQNLYKPDPCLQWTHPVGPIGARHTQVSLYYILRQLQYSVINYGTFRICCKSHQNFLSQITLGIRNCNVFTSYFVT